MSASRGRHPHRKSFSRLGVAGLVLALSAVAAMALSGAGFRLGWWPFATAVQIATWAVYGAVLAVLLSTIGAVRSRPGGPRRGLLLSLLGLAVALPVVAMGLQWDYAGRTYPPINDISTDLDDPPVLWDMPTPSHHPGADMAAVQRAAYPDLAPLRLSVPPARAHELALALAQRKRWVIVANEPDEGRIEAVASTPLYGFKDEVAVRITPWQGGARVDMRSRSRVGRGDRGVNANRIRAFLAALESRAAP